ncbi:hypothetical protein D918_07429 [Trichuris suis]|nr:hypothetical protein D918_07429 [Trichuris suis]
MLHFGNHGRIMKMKQTFRLGKLEAVSPKPLGSQAENVVTDNIREGVNCQDAQKSEAPRGEGSGGPWYETLGPRCRWTSKCGFAELEKCEAEVLLRAVEYAFTATSQA